MSRHVRRAARASRAVFSDCAVAVGRRVRKYVRKPRRVPWEARWCLLVALCVCWPAPEREDGPREHHTHTDMYSVPRYKDEQS